jgi:hypothetical protein
MASTNPSLKPAAAGVLDLSQKEAIKKKVIEETMKKLRAKKLAMKKPAPKIHPVKKIDINKLSKPAAVAKPLINKLT